MTAMLPVNREVTEALARRYERLGGVLPTHRAGHFDREALPHPAEWLERIGIEGPRERRGVWRTYRCPKHGGWSLRVNTESGAFCCMAGCGSGGDLLAFEQWRAGASFIEAARALGAWRDDPSGPLVRTDRRPAGLSASDALALIRRDVESLAIEAARAAKAGEIEPSIRGYLIATAARVLSVIRSREVAHV